MIHGSLELKQKTCLPYIQSCQDCLHQSKAIQLLRITSELSPVSSANSEKSGVTAGLHVQIASNIGPNACRLHRFVGEGASPSERSWIVSGSMSLCSVRTMSGSILFTKNLSLETVKTSSTSNKKLVERSRSLLRTRRGPRDRTRLSTLSFDYVLPLLDWTDPSSETYGSP